MEGVTTPPKPCYRVLYLETYPYHQSLNVDMAASENTNELELERGIISNVQTFSAVFKRIFLKVTFLYNYVINI